MSEFKYDWPTPGMKIFRDYTLDDYKTDVEKLREKNNVTVDGVVFVQVLNIEEETRNLFNMLLKKFYKYFLKKRQLSCLKQIHSSKALLDGLI